MAMLSYNNMFLFQFQSSRNLQMNEYVFRLLQTTFLFKKNSKLKNLYYGLEL